MSFVDYIFVSTEKNIGFWKWGALMYPQRTNVTSCFPKEYTVSLLNGKVYIFKLFKPINKIH